MPGVVLLNVDGFLVAPAASVHPDFLREALAEDRVFDQQGNVATSQEHAALVLLLRPDHPLIAIINALSHQFGVRIVPISRDLLRGTDVLLEKLDLPLNCVSQTEIQNVRRELLDHLCGKLGITNLRDWVTFCKGMNEAAFSEYIAKCFSGKVPEVTQAVQNFLKIAASLGYDQHETVNTLLSAAETQAENAEAQLFVNLMRQLAVLCDAQGFVDCFRGDFSISIMSCNEADRVADVPFTKLALPVSAATSVVELWQSEACVGAVAQLYLPSVNPLALLATLHNVRLFGFGPGTGTEGIPYLLSLVECPALWEACALLINSEDSVKQTIMSIVDVVRQQLLANQSVNIGLVDMPILELLQSAVAYYLKHNCIASTNLFAKDLSCQDQALLLLVAVFRDTKVVQPNMSGDGVRVCQFFAKYLSCVALSADDLRLMSLGQSGDIQRRLVANTLSAENIERVCAATQTVDGPFTFNSKKGLLVFVERGVQDPVESVLQGLHVLSLNEHKTIEVNPVYFDPCFLTQHNEDTYIRAFAQSIDGRLLVFSHHPRKKIFQDLPLVPSINEEVFGGPCIVRHPQNDQLPYTTVVLNQFGRDMVFFLRPGALLRYNPFLENNRPVIRRSLGRFLPGLLDCVGSLLSHPISDPAQKRFLLALRHAILRRLPNLQAHPRWREIERVILKRGSDQLYIDYLGNMTTTQAEWLRFLGFIVVSVATLLPVWFTPASEDPSFEFMIHELANIILASNPQAWVFFAALFSGSALFVAGSTLLSGYRLARYLLSCCYRPEQTELEDFVADILRRDRIRDLPVLSRLTLAAQKLRSSDDSVNSEDFTELLEILLELALKSKDSQSPQAINLISCCASGKQPWVISPRMRELMQRLTQAVTVLAMPIALSFWTVSMIKSHHIITSPAVERNDSAFLRFIATFGSIFFGDGSIGNFGIGRGLAALLMFFLFNVSWLLDAGSKLHQQGQRLQRAVVNCCGFFGQTIEPQLLSVNINSDDRDISRVDAGEATPLLS